MSIKYIKMILKEILSPTPSPKDVFNVRQSQIERIFKEFGKFMEKESSELKKKTFYLVRDTNLKENLKKVGFKAIASTLMKDFHQPYSEIKNMKLDDALFAIYYQSAKDEYIKQKIEQVKGNR